MPDASQGSPPPAGRGRNPGAHPRRTVVRGGTVIDASGERRCDVMFEDGRIAVVEPRIDVGRRDQDVDVLDATGCIVAPGLVDLHTHLREPGSENAETIESGARAAALGGYTAMVAMPNTDPPIDQASVVRSIRDLGSTAPCDVHVAGCISKGRAGVELAPLGELYDLGVRLFTDDGACVANAGLMRRAFEYARALPGAVLAQHCEDPDLALDGAMHEGAWSSRLGIPGMPAEAESVVVARDLELARLTGGRIHFLHLSTARSLALVALARGEGIHVTCEVAPHHFTLTDAACATYDPIFRVNPPLRSDGDLAQVKAAIGGGVVDAIATDHAPHAAHTKQRAFDEAPPGMLGLETALALTITELVQPGLITLRRAIELLSIAPAVIAGLDEHGGVIQPGRLAHLCIFDPTAMWEVRPEESASRSRNNPYGGRKLLGKIRHTVLRGEVVVRDELAQR